MIVQQAGIPASHSRSYDSTVLSGDDLKVIADLGVDEIRYWYGNGGYEGAGQMLLRKGKQWYYHDMGHCSCYGPIERLELHRPFATLGELIASCSQELRDEIEPLVEDGATGGKA